MPGCCQHSITLVGVTGRQVRVKHSRTSRCWPQEYTLRRKTTAHVGKDPIFAEGGAALMDDSGRLCLAFRRFTQFPK